jgi:glutamate formiminotransferase
MSSLTDPPLLGVPNVSEGRDRTSIAAIAAAFTAASTERLLDVHHDCDHHRAVFTLAGRPGSLARALVAGAAEAVGRVDITGGAPAGGDWGTPATVQAQTQRRGEHPHVGAVDVVPIVYLHPAQRGAACAEALVVADRIGVELGVPVFLYGELTATGGHSPEARAAGIPCAAGGRTRAELRRGGVQGLAARMRTGELTPDFGPPVPHPTAGVTLVCARGPLVAFNLELAPPATVEDARKIAALIREGGAEGLPGLRAIGVALRRGPAGAPRAEGAAMESGRRGGAGGEMERLGGAGTANERPGTGADAGRRGDTSAGAAEGRPGTSLEAGRQGAAVEAGRQRAAAEAERQGVTAAVAPGWPAGAEHVTAQVSMNVERPAEVPLRVVVDAVRAHAAVACAELVGLAPAAALVGFPADVPLPGFDPARHVLENALRL